MNLESIYISMTSLIGFTALCFVLVAETKELMFPKAVGASAVAALPQCLPAFVAVHEASLRTASSKRRLAVDIVGQRSAVWGLLMFIGWDHVLYLTIRVPPWVSQHLVWLHLDHFISTCKALQHWNSSAEISSSRCSPCQLQTVQVVRRPCPKRKTKEQ